jgi:hypothetical protein
MTKFGALVFRDGTNGGVLVSEHEKPSDGIRAAIEGKKAVTPGQMFGRVWWVAFPLDGGRWDVWYP